MADRRPRFSTPEARPVHPSRGTPYHMTQPAVTGPDAWPRNTDTRLLDRGTARSRWHCRGRARASPTPSASSVCRPSSTDPPPELTDELAGLLRNRHQHAGRRLRRPGCWRAQARPAWRIVPRVVVGTPAHLRIGCAARDLARLRPAGIEIASPSISQHRTPRRAARDDLRRDLQPTATRLAQFMASSLPRPGTPATPSSTATLATASASSPTSFQEAAGIVGSQITPAPNIGGSLQPGDSCRRGPTCDRDSGARSGVVGRGRLVAILLRRGTAHPA